MAKPAWLIAHEEARKARFFLYIHTDGSWHLKRHIDPKDIKEMVQSSFVEKLYEITELQWQELRRPLSPEERVNLRMSEIDARLMDRGVIRKLKG